MIINLYYSLRTILILFFFLERCFSTAVVSLSCTFCRHVSNNFSLLSSVWQKKRCKMKGGERAPVTAANGSAESETVSVPQFLPTSCDGDASTCSSRDGVAEGSSEGSSSSSSSSSSTAWDEPSSSILSVNGHCVGLNNGQLPMAKSKTEKRSFKRRRSKMADQQPQSRGRYGAGLLRAPIPVATCVMPALQQLMKGKQELGMGTFGVTAVTGHV